MTKVSYIISDIDKALAFEWIGLSIDKSRFSLSFILLNPAESEMERFLNIHDIPVTTVTCRGKKDWPRAWWRVYRLLKKQMPDVVHCHLLQANIIGLTAAKLAGIKKRIYTRHHSSLHHVYHKKGVWIDRLINSMSTKIIAISPIVKEILVKKENVPQGKIVLIAHGFELGEFESVRQERIEGFRTRHNLAGRYPVIGVVSRYTEWKGIQYVIPAFRRLLEHYPAACLLLLNARGDYKESITGLLKQLPLESFREIEFEKDVAAAYKNMNVFVHVPIDDHSEAFGQIYVEALAAGIPSVFTISGIAHEFVEDRKNGLVVPYKDADAIYEAVLTILRDAQLSETVRSEGLMNVRSLFGVHRMVKALEKLYEE